MSTRIMANALLATKIAFINEIADLCEQTYADVQDVARGIGLDGRIGSKFLNAGPGFGGSCFPKDTLALIKTAQDHGAPLRFQTSTMRTIPMAASTAPTRWRSSPNGTPSARSTSDG